MSKTTMNERRWRVASAFLWHIALLIGYFSREIYDGVRDFARVNPLEAWVNNPWFLPIALCFVVGRFVRDKGLSNGLSAVTSLYEAIGFGLMSLVAFSALPLRLILTGLPVNARILYLGYGLKLGSFLYLVSFFTRYLVFGDDNVFFRPHGRRGRPRKVRDEARSSD